MSQSKRLLLAVVLAALISGCAKGPERAVERVAVLPFENLSGQTQYDWLGSAAQVMIPAQLAPAGKIFAFAANSRAEALRQRATRLVAGYLTLRGGRLALEASVEDAGAVKRISRAAAEGSRDAGLLPLLDAVAKGIDGQARPYSTGNEGALQSLAAGNPAAAIEKDPAFSQAYVLQALAARNRGDRDGARKSIEAGRALGDKIAPLERAQLNVIDQTLGGDPAARETGLLELAKWNGNDADVHKQLAEIACLKREFKVCADRYQAAARADTENVEYWNSLGYARAMAGDLAAGAASLSEYAKRAPGDPNPLDSLGEIGFYHGKFAEAESSFLAAHGRNPGFVNGLELFKAAQSRLLLGDVKAAGDIFAKYSELLKQAGDQLLPVRQAIWDWMAGRRKTAYAKLDALQRDSGSAPQLAILARSQLAMLYLFAGRRDDARKLAGRMTAAVQFMNQPSASAAVWNRRAESVNAPAALKADLLMYSLLLDGHFTEAIPPLEGALRRSNPFSADSTEELLAWALTAAGRHKDAQTHLKHWPLPLTQSESALVCGAFPRMVEIRAGALAREGKTAEAARLNDLLKKLTAD